MNSPLKQVNAHHEPHRPKAAALYDKLFTADAHPPGFWVELFILPLSRPHLQQVLSTIPREKVVIDPIVLRTLFQAGAANTQSSDWFILTNSLEILEVVLEWLLAQNFSSQDILGAIAGLDTIDKVFDELGQGLSRALEHRPAVALEFFLRVLPGACGTSIGTYFSSRNLFRPLITLLDTEYSAQALTLIGVFCLLNKREEHADPYRIRISDFIDEEAVHTALRVIDAQLLSVSPIPHTTWFNWFQAETPRQINSQPLAILHCVYEFCLYNELFAVQFIRSKSFETFFAVASLVVQNQHTASKFRDYSVLILFIMRVMVERPSVFAEMCQKSNERPLLVAQQRSPRLTLDTSDRVPLAAVLDTAQCCLRFNIRRNLDHLMYDQVLITLFQAITATRDTPIRYDWVQLWRTLFSVMNHMAKDDTKVEKRTSELLLLCTATICLNPQLLDNEYPALIVKMVNSQELLKTFSLKFSLSKTAAMAAIHSMTAHYELLQSQTKDFELSPDTTAKILKQGNHALKMFDGDDSLLLLGGWMPKFAESQCQRFFAHESRTVLSDARWVDPA